MVKHTHKLLLVLISLSLLFMVVAENEINTAINIGVIIDLNSRLGKEQKTAMEVAVESFHSNNGGISSINHTLSLTFIDYKGGGGDHLLQTAISAQKLVEGNQAHVILVGVDNWQVASLVAQVGSQAQVPIFSLVSSPHLTPPLPYSIQWPFLVQMSHDSSQQIRDLVSIIRAYHWRRVTLVSEADPNGGDAISSLEFLMSEALQKIGSQIEHHVILPPFDSKKANPNENTTQEAFSKFLDQGCYSRVFVVLKVSRPHVSQLFKEAKRMGLMGNDSVWIVGKTITNLLTCCLDNSTMESMVGALGLMTKLNDSYIKPFQARFRIKSKELHEGNDREPSFDALIAYDAITTITKAISSLKNKSATTLKGRNFLREILRSNFKGLSGQVQFDLSNNTLLNHPDTKLVNIVGNNKYREILNFGSEDTDEDGTAKELASEVIIWPGNNSRGGVPKGWVMPTREKPMIIGLPVNHSYKNFINYSGQCVYGVPKTRGNITRENEEYGGFCPELFREVLKILGYDLPYRFVPYCGSYDDLIRHVYNKSYDAIVGDLTILANRTELVEFTLPFAESALSIVVPAVEAFNPHGPLIFLRPFTLGLWLLTLSLLLWTMLAVWLLEYNNQDSQEFNGPLMNQLSTALWFTFSTLFFAQREKISSKSARVVVVTWLFIVLVLTQSYTANLTSMLTIDKLNQTSIDIEMLMRRNLSVGYDNSSFVKIFLEDLFHFDGKNIVGIESQFEEFHKQFQLGNIQAAFFELLYAQLFLKKYCKQYTITIPRYRYGGLAFVFPKGSPVANDVSEAILELTERRHELSKLEDKYLKLKSECYISRDDFSAYDGGVGGGGNQSSSLRLNSFWILFVFSAGITTLCLLAFLLSSFNIMRWRRIPHPPHVQHFFG